VILYSIIPAEIIFNNNANEKIGNFKDVDYMGTKVQVMEKSQDEYVITRILSTSPGDFLNPNIQPGTIIKRMIQK
jgi:hypothetical protein